MVIRYFYLIGVAVTPFKTNPPLVINPDAILAPAITFELLQSISWWHSQVLQALGGIEHDQFAQRPTVNIVR